MVLLGFWESFLGTNLDILVMMVLMVI
jgi:hypothetical protein